jgi:single-strand DNA-binding protein
MAQARVQIVGNLTEDPELRYTQDGTPVTTFGVAVNARTRQGDEWVEGEPSFYRVTCWRDYAEHVAESLTKGSHVIVLGRMTARPWEDRDGQKRISYEITADEGGPSLRWATATLSKTSRRQDAPPVGDEPPF